MDGDGLKEYGKLCGWTRAKAQARGGDQRAIAVHFDEQKRFAEGVLEQATQHGDLAGADHKTFGEPLPRVTARQGRPRPEPPAQGAAAGGRSPATAG